MSYSIFFSIITLFTFYSLGLLFNYVLKIKNIICKKDILIFSIGSLVFGNITFIILSFSILDYVFLEYIIILIGISGVLLFIKNNQKFVVNFTFFKKFQKLDFFIFILILVLLLLNFFQVFAPITNDDSLSYHFQIPKNYIFNNGFIYDPFIPYNSPHLLEIIHVIPFMFGGELSIKLLLYLISVLLCLKIFNICNYYFNLRSGLIAVLLVISTPKFAYINSSGIVEIYLAFITIGAIWIYSEIFNIIKFKNNDENLSFNDLVIYGAVLLGGVASIKYYGLFSVLSLSVAVLYFIIRYNFKNYKKLLFLSIIFGSIFLLPFYIKNIIFTGNPLYPKLFTIFGGVDWSESLSILTNDFFSEQKRLQFTFQNFFLSPFYLFLDNNTVSGRSGYGILILMLVPVIIREYFYTNLKLQNSKLNVSLIFYYILSIWVLWFLFSFHRDRHLIVIIILLSIFIGNAVMNLSNEKNNLPLKIITIFIFIVGMFPNVIAHIFFNQKYLELYFSDNTKIEFNEKYLPLQNEFLIINKFLDPKSKIINLVGNRQYFLDHKQFYPSPAFQGQFDFSKLRDHDELYKQIKENKFTHIITLFEPNELILNSYEKINSTNFLENYNKLFNNLILEYCTNIYESEIVNIMQSRTLNLGSYERKLLLYQIN